MSRDMSELDPRMWASGQSTTRAATQQQRQQLTVDTSDELPITSALGRLLAQSSPTTPTIAAPSPPPRSDSLGRLPSPLPSRPAPIPSSSSSSSVYPSSSLLTVEDLHHAPNASTETLPQYSRRAPLAAAVEDEPPLKSFSFQSRSRKMALKFDATGEAHPILLQPEPEARSHLKGNLILSLATGEPITHIRIRLKGVVRTMVMKVHGSGRHPVTDEVTIWEDSSLLYQRESSSAGQDLICLSPDPNLSSDSSKLQGTLNFPFSLQIPSRVVRPGAAGIAGRRMRPPPSFMLGSSAGDGDSMGTEWASCRYFLKVTLGRRGLLKSNERWMVPIVYVPRAQTPAMSDARMLAQAAAQPIPGPLEDPIGWAGKKTKHTVKRGMFTRGNKQAQYEVVLLLPSPAKFTRTTAVPFALKLTSTDPELTTRFPRSAISIFLLQRTHIGAQGISSTHDLIVGRATLHDDGPSEGVLIPREEGAGEDVPVWGKRFQGQIKLSKSVGSSFKAPNLTVSFQVGCYITVPGTGNDSEVFVPIEILSSLRAGSSQSSITVAPTPAHFLTAAGYTNPSAAPSPSIPQGGTAAELDSAVLSQSPPSNGHRMPITALDSNGATPINGAHPSAPIPMAAHEPPPPTWAESVSPQTPGGWLSMPPAYFENGLNRVQEEGGDGEDDGDETEREAELVADDGSGEGDDEGELGLARSP